MNRIGLALVLLLVLIVGAASAAEPAPLVPDYAKGHPRLLFDNAFVAVLKDRAKQQPDMWQPVVAMAKRLAAAVPDQKTIREGKQYYKADWMLAAAMAYRVGGEARFRDSCIAWMKVHCQTEVWGVGWRENVDIPANWYMYYIKPLPARSPAKSSFLSVNPSRPDPRINPVSYQSLD